MLSEAMTALAEFVADRIINRCGMPLPQGFRILRYHGGPPPEDLDCGGGYLAVWWEGPAFAPTDQAGPRAQCPGPLTVVLGVKYVQCWQPADVDEDGITLHDTTWDADAAVLADLAQCITNHLLVFSCDDMDGLFSDEAYQEVARTLLRLRFLGVTPAAPQGAAASITWRVAGVVQSPSVS